MEIKPRRVKPLSSLKFAVRRANSNSRLRVKIPCEHIIAAESAYAGGRSK